MITCNCTEPCTIKELVSLFTRLLDGFYLRSQVIWLPGYKASTLAGQGQIFFDSESGQLIVQTSVDSFLAARSSEMFKIFFFGFL